MGINKSTAKKLQYRRVFWPGNIKSTGTVNRYFRVIEKKQTKFGQRQFHGELKFRLMIWYEVSWQEGRRECRKK